jgi:hypothetical protein
VAVATADDPVHAPAPARAPRVGSWPWLALWLAVAGATALLVRLPGPPTLDPDEYASALYFDRLIHGRRLEELLLSTPKPLLTLVDGLAWTLTHDWRTISVLTVAVFALAVTALARAAGRLAGPPAAVAVVVALVGSAPLISQVGRGNSSIWALAGWAVALDALARPRRRWGVAAAALLLASLARAESLLLLPPAALLGLVAWRRGERRALLLLVPLAAPLLWLGHDLALTGDALRSLEVPERYTDLVSGRHAVAPLEWTGQVAQRYRATPLLSALAVLGVVGLVRRRAWLWLTGLGVVVVGVLAFLGVEAWRGTYISFRYYDPPDAGMRVLAALGAAWLAAAAPLALRALGGGRCRTVLGALLGGLLAGAVTATAAWPLALTNQQLVRSTLDPSADLSRDTAIAVRALRPLVAAPGTVVAVPIMQRPRIALELGLPLGRVRDLFLSTLHQPLDTALSGTVAVFYDQNELPLKPRFAPLSTTIPKRIGRLQVAPLLVDPGRGLYVLRVAPA